MSSICVSAVEGNGQMLDGGAMFGNAPRAVWEKWIPPDEQGRIPLACRALLVEIDNKKILCETGIGAFFEPKLAERFGVQTPQVHQLLVNLKKMGIAAKDIDFVILSHLHFDHAGGLLPTYSEIQNGNEDLVFPNAQFVVGKTAWERAIHPHPRDRASFIDGLTDKLKKSERLIVAEDNFVKNIFPEHIQFFTSDGHTPGQLHTIVKGQHKSMVFCGDLVPGIPWVHLPITMGYDRFPEKLIEEKATLYEKALTSEWLLFFTHDVKIACAALKKDEKGRYHPFQPIENLQRFAL